MKGLRAWNPERVWGPVCVCVKRDAVQTTGGNIHEAWVTYRVRLEHANSALLQLRT